MAVVALLLFSACSLPEAVPDRTRFYVLTPVAAVASEGAAGSSAADGAQRSVLLRSVVVPEYLRGKIMQVRLAANEVRFVDVARWAEPLDAGIERVLRENLENGSPGVRIVGRGGEAHDYEIAIQVRHCEGVLPEGVARVAARIEIYSGGLDAELVAEDDFVAEIPRWNGRDYGELAAKLSEAAAALSERIVALLPAESRSAR